MRRFVWSRTAQDDLETIRAHWIDSRPDYVFALAAAAEDAIDLLTRTPGIGTPIGKSVRKWRLGRTPYLLLYTFTKTDVRVARVHHESQNWRPVSE